MKVELFPFQKRACDALRSEVIDAMSSYMRRRVPQVISFTAPTGAGKTIIMASLIENILYGSGVYLDQPDAIFVWLSDSPQLNEQSKQKIETKADKIKIGQCVTIEDDSFDKEFLEDGQIYFLNTQKLGKSSNLTKQGDSRQYTIWETLSNTILEKRDRLYFIIDEAHRGAQGNEAARATTIMQRFIKGYRVEENGRTIVDLPPMPVVIGMSATTQRFNKLVRGTGIATFRTCVVTADEVRSSGLLKERIIITYPENMTIEKEMAVLQAAAVDWKNKWDHWYQYCKEQHYTQVYPVFVVQVLNGTNNIITHTNLDDCLSKIEESTGFKFKPGEVVHTFGQTSTALIVNGLEVKYVEASQITDNKNIKVVFFKENLSTGWDCPRAETMMSFRHAVDATYIAQLLGRMVRTPLQSHILVDDILNDVHLFLPHFDETTVKQVVEELQNSEGGDIPTDIYEDSLYGSSIEVWTTGLEDSLEEAETEEETIPEEEAILLEENVPQEERIQQAREQALSVDTKQAEQQPIREEHPVTPIVPFAEHTLFHQPSRHEVPKTNILQPNNSQPAQNQTVQTSFSTPVHPSATYRHTVPQPSPIPPRRKHKPKDGIDRDDILSFINESGLLTYNVRKVTITNYLGSLLKMIHVLSQSGLNPSAVEEVQNEIADKIHDYVQELKERELYEELCQQVRQFELNSQIFDALGQSIENTSTRNLFTTTDVDIERQFRVAENKLGNDGIGYVYGNKYGDLFNPTVFMIEVILFTYDPHCREQLENYAKEKFHAYIDTYRRQIARVDSERVTRLWDSIVSDGDVVSKHNFRIPEVVAFTTNSDGKEYTDHLLVNPKTGKAKIKLNSWEEATLREEQSRSDYVCWLRNPSRYAWALCIPYRYNGEWKAFYPDIIIVRKEGDSYVLDILEPHNPVFDDNLGKAQGLAEYARQNPGVGRIQLIRKVEAVGRPRLRRLDMSRIAVRDAVSHAASPEELNNLFTTHGTFED